MQLASCEKINKIIVDYLLSECFNCWCCRIRVMQFSFFFSNRPDLNGQGVSVREEYKVFCFLENRRITEMLWNEFGTN